MGTLKTPSKTPDRECVGYEQAIARRAELQGSTGAAFVPARAGAAGQTTSGQAALFQQQLAAATMQGLTQADGDAATSGGALPGAPADPYAALQSGGLSAQAGIMAQMQGVLAQGQGAQAPAPGGFTVAQLESMLAQARGAAPTAQAAGAGPVTYANLTGKTKQLDQDLLRSLDQLGAQLGRKLDIISGNRTTAEQAVLYQKYLNGTGNLAAPPGSSNHEHGDAADVYVDGVALANVPGAADAAKRLGLHFPVRGEAWHVERTDH